MGGREKTAAIVEALYERHIKDCCIEEMALHGFKRRVDFWVISPHKDNEAISYEIKVSKSDYKADGKEKQEAALNYSNKFYYVIPKGMINKKDIPRWAGLMEWDGKSLRITKSSPKTEKPIVDWWFLTSAIRNSKNVRRDTFLMRDNNRLLKQENKHLTGTNKVLMEEIIKLRAALWDERKSNNEK